MKSVKRSAISPEIATKKTRKEDQQDVIMISSDESDTSSHEGNTISSDEDETSSKVGDIVILSSDDDTSSQHFNGSHDDFQELYQSIEDSPLLKKMVDRIKNKINVTELEFIETVATGGQGSVHRAMWRGSIVAVKKITRSCIDDDAMKLMLREILVMQELHDPLFVQLLGVTFDTCSRYLILEFCEGKTLSYFIQDNKFSPEVKNLVGDQIAKAVAYLHAQRNTIVHSDIKPCNIIVNPCSHWKVKICDFGMVTRQSLDMCLENGQDKDFRGTIVYAAPELFKDSEPDTKSDVWSLACTILELYTGEATWGQYGLNMTSMLNKFEGKEKPKNLINENIPKEIQMWISEAFSYEPCERPTAAMLWQMYDERNYKT